MTKFKVFKKQFIAGAVCPQCQQLDRIVVEKALAPAVSQQIYTRRRCVDCDFTDEFNIAEDVQVVGVPKGRPEKPKAAHTPSSAVRIVDLHKPKTS